MDPDKTTEIERERLEFDLKIGLLCLNDSHQLTYDWTTIWREREREREN